MALPDISELVGSSMERFSVRSGNGTSLQPGGVISRHARGDDGSSELVTGFPRAELPDFLGGQFLFNLVPMGGIAQSPFASVPRSNVKAYIKMLMTPTPFTHGGANWDAAYADVDSLTLITVAYENTPARVNASVTILTGAVTQGTYYFYCGKLFDNGTAQGLSSAESQDDIDFFYPNITSFGWLPPPSALIHYPPIDLV